jgi:hypothetical protein
MEHPSFPNKKTSLASAWLHTPAQCKFLFFLPLQDLVGRLLMTKLRCGTKINRTTSDLSCSNLIKHASASKAKHKRTVLWLDLGLPVRGRLSQKRYAFQHHSFLWDCKIRLDIPQVPQLCTIWCAKAARPFSALVEASHQKILHPTVLKNLPTKKAVSKDIHLLYSAIQDSYQTTLQVRNPLFSIFEVCAIRLLIIQLSYVFRHTKAHYT